MLRSIKRGLKMLYRKIKLAFQVGLEEENIRNKICEIMEGGKDAFDKRYKRIRALS